MGQGKIRLRQGSEWYIWTLKTEKCMNSGMEYSEIIVGSLISTLKWQAQSKPTNWIRRPFFKERLDSQRNCPHPLLQLKSPRVFILPPHDFHVFTISTLSHDDDKAMLSILWALPFLLDKKNERVRHLEWVETPSIPMINIKSN